MEDLLVAIVWKSKFTTPGKHAEVSNWIALLLQLVICIAELRPQNLDSVHFTAIIDHNSKITRRRNWLKRGFEIPTISNRNPKPLSMSQHHCPSCVTATNANAQEARVKWKKWSHAVEEDSGSIPASHKCISFLSV